MGLERSSPYDLSKLTNQGSSRTEPHSEEELLEVELKMKERGKGKVMIKVVERKSQEIINGRWSSGTLEKFSYLVPLVKNPVKPMPSKNEQQKLIEIKFHAYLFLNKRIESSRTVL